MREFIDILKINKDQFQFSETLPHFPVFTLFTTVSSGNPSTCGQSQDFTPFEESLWPWAGSAGCEHHKLSEGSAQPTLTHLRPNLPPCQEFLFPPKNVVCKQLVVVVKLL